MSLIAEFRASAEFRRLSASSIRSYSSYIKLIENEFGDLPLAALEDRRIRGEFKIWRDLRDSLFDAGSGAERRSGGKRG